MVDRAVKCKKGFIKFKTQNYRLQEQRFGDHSVGYQSFRNVSYLIFCPNVAFETPLRLIETIKKQLVYNVYTTFQSTYFLTLKRCKKNLYETFL